METIEVITPYPDEPDFKKIEFTVGEFAIEAEIIPAEMGYGDRVILSGYHKPTKRSAWVTMRAPEKGSVLTPKTNNITFEIGSGEGDGVETNARSAKEWSHVAYVYSLMDSLKKFLK